MTVIDGGNSIIEAALDLAGIAKSVTVFEFLPQLKEGAVVVNVVRISGVAIEESAEQNTRLEKLLLEEFPDEVRHVWSRIGTAAVATDPMGTELSDIFMSLHPRERWTRARTQEELTAQMQELVAQVPGANYAFTQPIVMRLNEMASGIRSDLGVKILGDDFTVLQVIDDPTRAFRAARFAARFGWRLARESAESLRDAVAGGLVARLSAERRRGELELLFAESGWGKIARRLRARDPAGYAALREELYGALAGAHQDGERAALLLAMLADPADEDDALLQAEAETVEQPAFAPAALVPTIRVGT